MKPQNHATRSASEAAVQLDPHNLSTYPPADLAIERIGYLRHFNLSMLVGPANGRDRGQEAT